MRNKAKRYFQLVQHADDKISEEDWDRLGWQTFHNLVVKSGSIGIAGVVCYFAPIQYIDNVVPLFLVYPPIGFGTYWLLTFRQNTTTFNLLEELVNKYDLD
jgi:hypothetical protein